MFLRRSRKQDGLKLLCFFLHESKTFSLLVSPQGSYWAIDTNPKEDTVPSRPKKRPRSGERVNLTLVISRAKLPVCLFQMRSRGKTRRMVKKAGDVKVEKTEREKSGCTGGGEEGGASVF